MSLDTQVKQKIYQHFAATGRAPSVAEIATETNAAVADVRTAYQRLREQRVLVLEADGETIWMAPPFSGVPTQHTVSIGDRQYFANCAWDSFGIVAALHRPGVVQSRCERSLDPLHLQVDLDGPERRGWVFHCGVPAAHWWRDIVFT